MAGRIVVGVDGSAASDRALHWAASEARRRGATLVAAHAWYNPGNPYMSSEDVRSIADRELDKALEGFSPDGVTIEPLLLQGKTAAALVKEAEGADLLVVGTRGHTAIGAVIGSVASACIRHSGCPVVVVPEEGSGSIPDE